jgi:hypothetical protein
MPDKHHLLILLLLPIWLSACAERTIPSVSPHPHLTETVAQVADTSAESVVVGVAEKMTPIQEMLACIERGESLESASLAKEMVRLQAHLELSQALDKPALDQHLSDKQAQSESRLQRFCLACLLSRDTANNTEWARARTLLSALTQDIEREEERQLVGLMMRTLNLKTQLRQHQTKLNRLHEQNNELLDKIEQLKGLERDLDVTRPLSSESAL